jgi:hypothetical protein
MRSLFGNDPSDVFLRRAGADAGLFLDCSQRPERLVSIGLEATVGLYRCKGAIQEITFFPLYPSTGLQKTEYVLARQLPSAFGQAKDQKA